MKRDELDELVERFENLDRKTKTSIVNYTGEYRNLPCIRRILDGGFPDGARHTMTRQLAYACIKDNYPLSKALEISRKFYSHCYDKKEFDYSEVKKWFEWAYSRPDDAYLECHVIRYSGYCMAETIEQCELYKHKREKITEAENQQALQGKANKTPTETLNIFQTELIDARKEWIKTIEANTKGWQRAEKFQRRVKQLKEENKTLKSKIGKEKAKQKEIKILREKKENRGGRREKKLDDKKIINYMIQGLSDRKIAKKLGVSHPTIAKRRRKLQEAIERLTQQN